MSLSFPLQPATGILGALLLAATFALMLRGVQPFVTHAYELSWWSLIAALDGVVWWRNGRSMIFHAPFRFLLLALWSVAFWLFFELVNLRLRNWHYIYVSPGEIERWTGSFLSFATVIPGIFLFAEALSAFGLFRPRPPRDLPRETRVPTWLPPALTVLGIGFLVLPLVWPRTFYPLVWGSLVLTLDPLNRKLGGRSLLGEWERGSARTFFLYLSAGAIAGLFWEFLNFWARVKWIYTVPFFEELKLFEMPFLGFLGFPPFALECWVAAETLRVLGLIPGSRPGSERRAFCLAAALFSSGLAAGLALPAMERHTFASTYPLVEDLPGLSAAERAALRARGIEDCFELWEELQKRGEGQSPLRRRVALILHAGIGIEKALALESLGVGSVEELARTEPAEIGRQLQALNLRHVPLAAEIRYWVRKARARV